MDNDVVNGLVSREAAYGTYGVVLDGPERGLDLEETENLRSTVRKQRLVDGE